MRPLEHDRGNGEAEIWNRIDTRRKHKSPCTPYSVGAFHRLCHVTLNSWIRLSAAGTMVINQQTMFQGLLCSPGMCMCRANCRDDHITSSSNTITKAQQTCFTSQRRTKVATNCFEISSGSNFVLPRSHSPETKCSRTKKPVKANAPCYVNSCPHIRAVNERPRHQSRLPPFQKEGKWVVCA